MNLAFLCTAVFAIAAIGTSMMRRHALATGMLDTPNARSSHVAPTPRGGGAAIVAAGSVGLALAAATDVLSWRDAVVWLLGGVAVAVVGFIDDRSGLAPRVRLTVHGLAAAGVAASFGLGGLVAPDGTAMALGIGGMVLAWLAVVWSINLFNFMDGIDGFAASQAVFVLVAGAALTPQAGGTTAAAVVASATLGFLLFNWPPARIFMGDVGSGYLGFAIACAALQSGEAGATSAWVWLLLYGVFVTDATTTLVVRAIRGKRLYEAHRSHAYQILARRWSSHLRVTLLALAVCVGWLLPLAIGAARRPSAGWLLCAVGLAPLAVLSFMVGAGRRDD